MMGGHIAQDRPGGNGRFACRRNANGPAGAGPLQNSQGIGGQTNWTVTIS
jgi:hypothetical protein